MAVSKILLRAFVGLVLLWLMIPIVIIVPMSFSSARFLAFPPPSWSLRWYEAYLASPAWMQATRVSLTVAVSSAIIATVMGTAAAYALNLANSRLVRSLQVVLMLPLVVPIVITAVGVFLVYANVGLLATMTGLVLANVMLGLPYVITSVLVGLRKFDPAQEMVSRSLGMNRLRTFFIVTLPQIRPSVITGLLFAFISALDETVVALFISGGQYQTLTKRMFTALRDEIDPTIAAISTLLTAVSFLVVMLVALSARGEAKSNAAS
jgi:putative spermidine/putrescine transport system permease protein